MQSVIPVERADTIDRISPTQNGATLFRCGALVVGSSKSADRHCITSFDLRNPASGLRLDGLTNVQTAELWGNVTGVVGGAYTLITRRLTRYDYDYLTATWNEYKAGSAWLTTPGGDSSPEPAIVSTPFPSSTGDILIVSDLTAHVRDAIANHDGIVSLLWSIFPEGPSNSEHVTVKASPRSDSDTMRLIVTYTTNAPTPIASPQSHKLGSGVAPPAAPTSAALAMRPSAAPKPPRTKQPVR